MLDKQLAVQATEAMQRAARFGIGPISESTVNAIERALSGMNNASQTCLDSDHPGNVISFPDDHVQDRD